MAKALTVDAAIDAPDGKLGSAALLVINPPYGFDAAMQAGAALIAPRLGARIRTQWVAGSE